MTLERTLRIVGGRHGGAATTRGTRSKTRRNPEDRLRKDYDVVENLGDLIAAREERDSAFADDSDAVEDIDLDHLEVDENQELTYPHKHKPSKDHKLGIDIELMDTPNERDMEFDWQDSADQMLATDPDPNAGMDDEIMVEGVTYVSPGDVPEQSVEADSADALEEQ